MTKIGDWWVGDDFIGEFDTDYDTSKMIELFKYHQDCGSAFKRLGFNEQKDGRDRDDEAVCSVDIVSFPINESMLNFQKEYNDVIEECLDTYRVKFSTLQTTGIQQCYLNIQKTSPGNGYHIWHHENPGGPYGNRALATMMYLNDVEEGGETEFLYQHKRFKPVAGRVLIWPAGFTHTHRGNPPLKGDKYIATSWVEWHYPAMIV